jgi:sugar phosphate isomerase/epimerase
MRGDGDEFSRLEVALASMSVRARAANVFLPGDLALVGPTRDQSRICRYVEEAMARLARLGITTLAFGSGKARVVPDSYDRGAALDEIEQFLRFAGEEAAQHQITLALEPLGRSETNVFTTVRESARFLRERGLIGVSLLADLFHMMEEGEDLDAVREHGRYLAHVHVADSHRRPPGQGSWDLEGFFAALSDAGYTGDCSIECRWMDFQRELGPSLAYLRRVTPRTELAS